LRVCEHGLAAVDDERGAELVCERGRADAAEVELTCLDGCRVREEA
jgi:hypothetical protein